MTLTGKSRLLGIMGWPVAHSRSPQMQNAAIRAAGLDAVYVPLPVHPDNLGHVVRTLPMLGFVGVNVTIPHKQRVIEFLDKLTPEAETIGAVNTIRVEKDGKLTGHNSDCLGAVGAMENDGTTVKGKTAVIIGAGGAGRGVAAGCAMAGARRIIILNRNRLKSWDLVDELKSKIRPAEGIEWQEFDLKAGFDPAALDWHSVDAVYQMTSLGMEGDETLPMDVGLLRPDCHVLEAVYAPLETPFLKAARARGLRTSDGLAMLLEQGALSFQFWFGKAPDRQVMRGALSDP